MAVVPLAVDSAGFAYISGINCGGDIFSAFLTKLNQSGTAAVSSICLPNISSISAIAVDPWGYIYVLGTSTLLKLTPDASTVVYSATLKVNSASANRA